MKLTLWDRRIKTFLIIILIIMNMFLTCSRGVCQKTTHKKITAGLSTNSMSGVNLNDAKLAMTFWLKKVSERIGTNVSTQVEFFSNIDLVKKALNEKKLDLIVLLPLEYIQLKGKVALDPMMISVQDNNSMEYLVLLVNRESGIKSMEQLSNKKLIADIGGKGDIVKLWLDVLLLRRGISSSELFFSSIKMVESPSKAVLPVYFRQSDACIVTERAFETIRELNPDVGKKLLILEKSERFPSVILCIRSDYEDLEHRKIIEETGLNFHKNEEGRQILMLFRQKKLLQFDNSYLSNVEKLLNEYKRLKKSINKKGGKTV